MYKVADGESKFFFPDTADVFISRSAVDEISNDQFRTDLPYTLRRRCRDDLRAYTDATHSRLRATSAIGPIQSVGLQYLAHALASFKLSITRIVCPLRGLLRGWLYQVSFTGACSTRNMAVQHRIVDRAPRRSFSNFIFLSSGISRSTPDVRQTTYILHLPPSCWHL